MKMSALKRRFFSLEKTTVASIGSWKYFWAVWVSCSLTCSRSESPTSRCLPFTVNCMILPFYQCFLPSYTRFNIKIKLTGCLFIPIFQAAALNRGGNFHSFAVFGDSPPRDGNPLFLQRIDQIVVGEDGCRVFGANQGLDPRLARLRREPGGTGGVRHAAGEKILQFERPARRADIFVGGDAAYRALMHADRIGDVFQHQRLQAFNSVREKRPFP